MTKKNVNQLFQLGEWHFRRKNYPLAESIFKQILQIQPSHSASNEFLGYLYGNQGQKDLAKSYLEIACRSKHSSAEANYYLGSLYLKLGDYQNSINYLKKALQISGGFFEGFHDLGTAHSLQGLKSEALQNYKKAISLNPNNPVAHFNLGKVAQDLRLLSDALHHYQICCKLEKNNRSAWTNMGEVLNDLGQYDEALQACDEAIRIDPSQPSGWLNKGAVLYNIRSYPQALDCYNKALSLDSSSSIGHLNKSLIELSLGNFFEGWSHYEHRPALKELETKWAPKFKKLENLGDCVGKTLLVVAEQGYGDTLQFVRYLPELKKLDMNVVLLVPNLLLSLLDKQFDCVVTSSESFDVEPNFFVSLLSLPRLFNTNLASIPSRTPYLSIPTNVINEKKKHILNNGKLNLGIAYSGNPIHSNDKNRSMPLEKILPLTKYANLYLLQKNTNQQDLEILEKYPEIRVLENEISDFLDTAGFVENMSAVVTVDTSLAHLAGALNKKTFVLLPWNMDWRWLIDRPDSPWYPSLELLRQSNTKEWDPVISELIEKIRLLTSCL